MGRPAYLRPYRSISLRPDWLSSYHHIHGSVSDGAVLEIQLETLTRFVGYPEMSSVEARRDENLVVRIGLAGHLVKSHRKGVRAFGNGTTEAL